MGGGGSEVKWSAYPIQIASFMFNSDWLKSGAPHGRERERK
jgi:hypothetical protein